MASYKIGKILGINIELDISFILFLLLFFILSVYALSIEVFIVIVLLFVCVLIHELTHSVTSLRNGIKVKKIILLPIGGASIIDETAIKPDVEFRIAIVGPLMSLLLGGIFGILTIFSPPGIISYTLQILFEINIFLGAFNLLPAFPMDGGRVFRSYLERKRNEYEATMLTVKASKYTMALILIGTIVYIAIISPSSLYNGSGLFLFFWNLIILMFLYGGAAAEQQLAEFKKAAAGLTIRAAMSKHFKLVSSSTRLQELYGIAQKSKEHIFITKTKTGYAYLNLLGKVNRDSAIASDVAVAIPTIRSNANMVSAIGALGSNEMGIAAIVKGQKLLGIVTQSQLQTFIALHVLRRERHLNRR